MQMVARGHRVGALPSRIAMDFSADDHRLLDLALREDIGGGDVTTEFFVAENEQASAACSPRNEPSLPEPK